MAVSKKPASQPQGIEEFINAGSTTETERKEKKPKKDKTTITVVMPTELLNDIDAALSLQKPRLNRTQWILKACYELLEQSKENPSS